MSFPPSLTTRVVHGRFVTIPDGRGAAGSLRIVLDDFMQGPADNVIVAPFDRTYCFDDGNVSVLLPSNNDPEWTHANYRIKITVGEFVHSQNLLVGYDSTGPIELSDVLNIPEPTPGESYIVAALKGVPNGIATLDANGYVVESQLPPGSGGDVSWNNVTDKPTVFPAAPPTWSDVTGKPTVFPAAAPAWTDVTGKPTTYPAAAPAWTDVTGKPTVFPSLAPTFSDVTDKPTTYPPSSHTHAFVDVTGKPSTYPPSAHGHVISEVTGLTTALDGKANATDVADAIDDLLPSAGGTIEGNLRVLDTIIFGSESGEVRVYRENPGQVRFDGAFDVAGELSLGGRAYMYAGGTLGNLGSPPGAPSSGATLYAMDGKAYVKNADDSVVELSQVGVKVLVLGPSDPVPVGTAAGTPIIRTAT